MSRTWVTWHSAGKVYTCDCPDGHARCAGAIVKKDRFCRVQLPPSHTGTGWSTVRLCTPCATDLGHVDPAIVGSAT